MQSIPTKNLEKLHSIFKSEKYSNSCKYSENFRYSIVTEPDLTIILGVKIPITIPISFHLPVELVSFYITLGIRPFWIDDPTINLLQSFAASFRDYIKNNLFQLQPYPYEFNFKDKEDEIKDYLKQLYPLPSDEQQNSKEFDDFLINLTIRDNYIKKYLSIDENLKNFSADVLSIAQDFNLSPVQTLPPEISLGIPKKREFKTVFLNRQKPSQFLIEEPGSITYFRDFIFNNTWIRTGFESNSCLIWYEIFKDQDFRLDYLIYDWMVYARGLIKSVLPLFDSQITEYIQRWKNFSDVAFLSNIPRESPIPGLFLPNLFYEIPFSTEIEIPQYLLLKEVPSTLNELYAEEIFHNGIELEKKGHFQESIRNLEESNELLKNFSQNDGRVKILLKLAELNLQLQNYSQTLRNLNESIDIVKKGDISLPIIMQIHQHFIHIYSLIKKPESVQEHYDIGATFLKSYKGKDIDVNHAFGEINMSAAKAYLRLKELDQSNLYFKQVLKYIEKNNGLEFSYFVNRAKFYHEKANINKQIAALQRAQSIENASLLARGQIYYDLAKIFLETKLDSKKSLGYIEKGLELEFSVDYYSLNLKIDLLHLKREIYREKGISEEVSELTNEITSLKSKLLLL